MTDDLTDLLHRVADEAGRFRAGLADQPVAPEADLAGVLPVFDLPLPDRGVPPAQVVEELLGAGPGLMGRRRGPAEGAGPAALVRAWRASGP